MTAQDRHNEAQEPNDSLHNEPAPPLDIECMGVGCSNRAKYMVRGLDPDLAIADHPIYCCRGCFDTIDFFKWIDHDRKKATDG